MSDTEPPRVVISSITHDLIEEESIVTLSWPEDQDKRLALPVPFGCSLEELQQEAAKALRVLSDECAELAVEIQN
ncbi:hypothetical protein [Roseibium sp. SCP14]|uniref:hypothetical protein n=1 Tax=Roseibium sp. SCP14 TaxID=3141375 RepID=UPI003334C6BB